MDKNIVVTTALREKFSAAWKQRQVILFSAPCGFGKTTTALALLEGRAICRWDALEANQPEREIRGEAVLLDNLQALKSPDAQQELCGTIRRHPEVHFVLLTRGAVPGWLMPFQFEPRMEVFEAQDLMLDQEAAEKLLEFFGVTPTSAAVLLERSKGYPLAMSLLAHEMRDGRPFDNTMDADVRRELFAHFQTAVYQRLEPAARRLLLDLAPFEPLDVEFARILSGNSCAGEILGELQQDTTMFHFDSLRRCRFWPLFRQFLLWQQDRDYSAEEQRRLFIMSCMTITKTPWTATPSAAISAGYACLSAEDKEIMESRHPKPLWKALLLLTVPRSLSKNFAKASMKPAQIFRI